MLSWNNFGGKLAPPPAVQGLDAFPSHESRNSKKNGDESQTHCGINMRGAFEPLDDLGPRFHAGDGADDHDHPQFDVNIAEGSMFPRGND